MAQLNAYIHFQGKCREGMNFYKDCFGGELDLQEIPGGNIMHSSLTTDKFTIMGSDMMDDDNFKKEGTVSIAVMAESSDELNTLFDKLSEDGNVRQPLQEAPFGIYGELTDKYGVNWMFQFDPKAR